jgi:hypothetical protein
LFQDVAVSLGSILNALIAVMNFRQAQTQSLLQGPQRQINIQAV